MNTQPTAIQITKPGKLDIEENDADTYFTVTTLGKMQLRTLSNSR